MTRTRARQCVGKVRHDKRHDALDHLWRLVRKGARLSRLNVYRCGFCGGLHVGHKLRRSR
jgi:hypothetical protein